MIKLYVCVCKYEKDLKHKLRYDWLLSEWIYIIQEVKCICGMVENE